ncbi:MAG: hypothetical protein Q9187_006196, partial [Circinaria calcarea]
MSWHHSNGFVDDLICLIITRFQELFPAADLSDRGALQEQARRLKLWKDGKDVLDSKLGNSRDLTSQVIDNLIHLTQVQVQTLVYRQPSLEQGLIDKLDQTIEQASQITGTSSNARRRCLKPSSDYSAGSLTAEVDQITKIIDNLYNISSAVDRLSETNDSNESKRLQNGGIDSYIDRSIPFLSSSSERLAGGGFTEYNHPNAPDIGQALCPVCDVKQSMLGTDVDMNLNSAQDFVRDVFMWNVNREKKVPYSALFDTGSNQYNFMVRNDALELGYDIMSSSEKIQLK